MMMPKGYASGGPHNGELHPDTDAAEEDLGKAGADGRESLAEDEREVGVDERDWD